MLLTSSPPIPSSTAMPPLLPTGPFPQTRMKAGQLEPRLHGDSVIRNPKQRKHPNKSTMMTQSSPIIQREEEFLYDRA